MKRIVRAFFVFLMLSVLAGVSSAFAVTVDVPWVEKEGLTLQQKKRATLEKGFDMAVAQQALSLLPVQPTEKQKSALESYFTGKGSSYVGGYEDKGMVENEEGSFLRMKAQVDAQPLKEILKQTGIYYAAGREKECTLELSGAPGNTRKVLDRLLALNGLTPSLDVLPKLTISYADGIWKGSLETVEQHYVDASDKLETLWHALWESYYLGATQEQAAAVAAPKEQAQTTGDQAPKSQDQASASSSDSTVSTVSKESTDSPESETAEEGMQTASDENISIGPAEPATLQMKGWFQPDGVYAFNSVLKSWAPVVQGPVLRKLDMQASGVGAIWKLEVTNKEAFARRLDEYVQNRGLTYTVE